MTKNFICTEAKVHQGLVDQVKKQMPDFEQLLDLSNLFKVLGDKTRVSILFALSQAELCVCDLCAVLGMSSSAISHQLRLLKAARLVRFRREGKFVYYTLDDDHVRGLFIQALEHIQE